jgi:multiple sugar transport system substrate-binding protein
MSTRVYTPEGLFDFTSEPAIEALKLMKRIMAFSTPDILLEGASDAGVNGTPDEVAFAAQRVGLYFKYFSAPLLMAESWDDPKLLHLGPLPKFANGELRRCFGRQDARSSSVVRTRKRQPSTSRR